MATIDLSKYGITGTTEIVYNPSYDVLFEEETKAGLEGYEVGQETELGAVNVMTGIYTGRSPKDKYIVMDKNSKDTVWWTSDEYKNDNHPMTEDTWAVVKDIAKKELCNKRLFVVDAFCGANKDTRMAIRFIVEVAWQAHFVTNMFIKPTAEELENFEPDFVVYNASKAKVENYKELGLNSETCVAFNITSKEQVIINTWYGGEMKKGMFSMMNYFLPLKGMASMHCSANTDLNGENTAVFFGLSGTGKTTLSTDPKRLLIGDDEHGWDDNGVFNFEGGCYAKVIDLDKDSEPDIYNAIRRDALLENVTVDANGKIDFADKSVTENTRVSYPIDHIKNIVRPISSAPAAKNVIFLSADAFGVLPPVSILTPEQTQYYFLSLLSQHLHSQLASDRHSLSYILQNTLRSLLRRCRRAELRLTSLIQDGTEPESVSLLRILVESSMQSLAEQSMKFLQRRSQCSTSKFLQSFRVLIQESLILVILTLMLLSGRQRLRILQTDSLRTLLSTREMLLVRHLLLLVLRHNSYYRISYIVYRKGLPLWQSFFDTVRS